MRGKARAPQGTVPALCLPLALVVTLAVALRCWFIFGGTVKNPMLGDAIQYCDYAWNLARSHIFSLAPPGSGTVTPDSFRDPGYPLLLACLLLLLGSGDAWYYAVLLIQAVLGALSAGLAMLIASRWLGQRAALLVGLAVALWPHNVAISSFLLTESLCGFLVLLAIGLLVRAAESSRPVLWAAAGLGFGAAALVNVTLTLFCPLLALCLMARRAAPRSALMALLLGSMLLPGAWSVRNLTIASESTAEGRGMINLVQGSWADYHSADYKARRGDEQAKQTIAAIGNDTQLAQKSPEAWLAVMLDRVEHDPLHYLAWYAWKPELLWAWSIRVGAGDIYPYPVAHSIYNVYPLMRLFESLCVAVNPVLFVLMAAAVILVLARPGKLGVPVGLYAAALLLAYETLIYTVLQSEPRYSIPFRPLQMMLAATAASWLWTLWSRRNGRVRALAEVPGTTNV